MKCLAMLQNIVFLSLKIDLDLANGADPDEMQHRKAFHLGLHRLLNQDQSSEKEIQYFG